MAFNEVQSYHSSPVEELKHLLQNEPCIARESFVAARTEDKQLLHGIKQETHSPFEHYLPTSPAESNASSLSGSSVSLSKQHGSQEDIAKTVAVPTISDSTSVLCDFLRGSSVADTPAPSPSSDEETPTQDKAGLFVEIKPDLKDKIPEGVRLPQRKGGMQLWQFLYTLLEDNYSELIQYTTGDSKLEFRLLEPDAVAIWWGHQKNRPNMNYDKLSRSLRYYYDKKIIQKVNGERYVYRFCCNPEYLYQALGNSESRPKLKEMPEAAKRAMEQNQALLSSSIHLPCEGTMLRALSAERLPVAVNTTLEVNALQIHMHSLHEDYSYPPVSYGNDIYSQNGPINTSPLEYPPVSVPPVTASEWGFPTPHPVSEPWCMESPTYSQYNPIPYGYEQSTHFSRPLQTVNPPTTSCSYSQAPVPYYRDYPQTCTGYCYGPM